MYEVMDKSDRYSYDELDRGPELFIYKNSVSLSFLNSTTLSPWI